MIYHELFLFQSPVIQKWLDSLWLIHQGHIMKYNKNEWLTIKLINT